LFERFTKRAKKVIVLAQDEARHVKHNYIGTEHLLFGVLREDEGLRARVLEDLGVTLEKVRAQVARVIGPGDEVTTGQIPFTPRAKKALELALHEIQALGSGDIGTEHVLLGVAREKEGVAARILLDPDVDDEKIRRRVVGMLGGRARNAGARSGRGPVFKAHEHPALPRPIRSFLLLGGWLLFGVSLGIGVLIGWAIRGL